MYIYFTYIYSQQRTYNVSIHIHILNGDTNEIFRQIKVRKEFLWEFHKIIFQNNIKIPLYAQQSA